MIFKPSLFDGLIYAATSRLISVLNLSSFTASPGRVAHFMFRPFSTKKKCYRPGSTQASYVSTVLHRNKCERRARPKQHMLRPCSTEKNVINRVRPKKDMFRPCSIEKKNTQPCSTQAKKFSTEPDQKNCSTVIDPRNICFLSSFTASRTSCSLYVSTVLHQKKSLIDRARAKQDMFRPSPTETNTIDRDRPKQAMFRPCSTETNVIDELDPSNICFDRARPKKNVLNHVRPKQDMFRPCSTEKNTRPCSTQARYFSTVLQRNKCDRPSSTQATYASTVLNRVRPKQDMFRPCSTEKKTLDRARPKQEFFDCARPKKIAQP